MNEKLKDFLSTKGASVFAVLAWFAFLIGGTFLAILTLALALTFEAFAQVKSKVISII
jgi:hypothetical protein